MTQSPDQMKLADRLKHKVFFDHEDSDFMFQYFMSNCGERGGSFGELWNVARRINQQDPASWTAEFLKEADRVRAIAERSLAEGHRVSAGDAFLRAYSYYRAAFCGLAPGEADHDAVYWKSSECFRKGIDAKSELIPHEWVEVEYKGFRFPGCLFKPDNSATPKPTIYLHNGGETHAEDHYFMYAQAGIDRGYNCLVLDGPWDPCVRFHEPDATYKSFPGSELAACWRAVTDMLLGRPDVDATRLVVAGESYGGAKTMFHASEDDRFAAVIANSPIYSIPELFRHANQYAPVYSGVSADASNVIVDKLPLMARATLKRVIWFHGFSSLVDWIPNAGFLHVDCSKIVSPFLCMYSESEDGELKRQAAYALAHVSSKVKGEVVGTVADGADLHCQINNLARGQQLMYDWLDQVLDHRIDR